MLGLYALGFGLGAVKFMFAAAAMMTAAELMPDPPGYWEITLVTYLGAIFSYSLFYFSAGFFMEKAKQKNLEKIKNGTFKVKKQFTRLNKFVVKMKLSKYGYIGLLIGGPMFMSIPIGSIVLAKFYRRLKITYWAELGILFFWANFFAVGNMFIFGK